MIKYFEKILYILGSSKQELPKLVFVFLFSSLVEVFGIGLLGPFFAIISDPEEVQSIPVLSNISSRLGFENANKLILLLCILIAGIFAIKSVLYFASKYYILNFGYSHRGKLAEMLNFAYLSSEYEYFISKNSANLIKNITFETQVFCDRVLLALLEGASNLVILVMLLLLMAISNLALLITTLAALLPVLILVYGIRDKLKTWGEIISEATENIIKTLNHGLGGFKETRVIGCSSYFESQMREYTKQYAKAASLSTSFGMLPRILIETSLVIFVIAFIGISQFFWQENSNKLVASLSVFAVASIRLLPAASQLMSALGSLQNTQHIVDILYMDLKGIQDQLIELKRNDQKTDDHDINFSNKICIKNISYKYIGTYSPAIQNASVEISKGESIAFIGKSGAGKTTIVDIILGLLTPQKGDITVDGISIYSNLRAWQNLVGYIPQSIFLLDDTIERNIAYGVPDSHIDYKKLDQAIAAAQLEELVNQLPNGLSTRLGERGVMLSGGQRQRIGIARAIYHEREILVLDEATSALDSETEKLVSESIQALAGNKTIITIAHRLSTIEHCDRVYLLEAGRITKIGKLAEILQKSFKA